jgi:DnaK suppressor protein
MNTLTDDMLRSSRARLVARGAELKDRIQRIGQDLRRANHPLPRDAPDAAIVIENDEVLQAIDETARRELSQIERALEKIDVGTFSKCESCGREIEAARLVAVPHAAVCGRCAKDA